VVFKGKADYVFYQFMHLFCRQKYANVLSHTVRKSLEICWKFIRRRDGGRRGIDATFSRGEAF
jgi:hypothetical protein